MLEARTFKCHGELAVTTSDGDIPRQVRYIFLFIQKKHLVYKLVCLYKIYAIHLRMLIEFGKHIMQDCI